MSKPRVLLVMNDFSRTGAPIVALALFGRLKRDFDIHVVSLSGGPLEQAFREAFRLTVLRPHVPGAKAIGRGRAMAYNVFSAGWQPDLIYVNTVAALPTWFRLSGVRRRKAPVLLHVHEGPAYMSEIESAYPGLIAQEPDRYIVVAEWIGECLRREYGVSADAMTVVRPPVGDEFLSEPALPVTRDTAGPIMIGGAGAPSWVKGTELWLLTAAELRRRDHSGERYRFRWVGDRGDEASHQMTNMINKLRLEDVVDFVPYTPDAMALYQDMDVFLMSSWEESASLVVLEAMALGKPVVCFKGSGGPYEEVADTGVVVEEFSPNAMADTIESLATDPVRRAALGAAARRKVREDFTIDLAAERLAGVISSSLRGSA